MGHEEAPNPAHPLRHRECDSAGSHGPIGDEILSGVDRGERLHLWRRDFACFDRNSGGRTETSSRGGDRGSGRSDVAGGTRQFIARTARAARRMVRTHSASVVPRTSLGGILSDRGWLRNGSQAALRVSTRGQILGCVRCSHPRDYRHLCIHDHLRGRAGRTLRRERAKRPGRFPLPRDSGIQSASRTDAGSRRQFLRSRSFTLSTRCARNLGSNGLDVVDARDWRSNSRRTHGYDGCFTSDGASLRRKRSRPARLGMAG